MQSFCCGVILGCISLLFWPVLPDNSLFGLIVFAPLLCFWRQWLLLGFLLAALHALWQINHYQAQQQTLLQQSESRWFLGEINNLVQWSELYISPEFSLIQTPFQRQIVRLQWPEPPKVVGQGQLWWLQLKCKAIAAP